MTLSASDGSGSGVSATYYTVDDGDQTTYSGAFTVSGDDQHEVDYWSVDAMGNTEATHTGYVNIDTTAPETTAGGLMTDGSSGWRNTAQTVTLSGDDDPGCGVAVTHYTIDGGATQTYSSPFTVSTQGSHLVAYWSVDAVGNTEAADSGYVNLDLTAPTAGSDADSAWHNSAVTVTLSPTDTGGSGVAFTQYRLQGASTWLPTPATSSSCRPRPITPATGHGPTSSRRSTWPATPVPSAPALVKIDTRAPTTTAAGLQANDHSGWRNTARR